MTTKKKILVALAAFVCVIAVAAISVLSTIAYFTSSAVVTNTFTIGSVGITMNESKVTKEGVRVEGAARVEGNSYHLVPGHTYVKDPIITVKASSEQSYLFVLVRNDLVDIAIDPDEETTGDETIAEQMYMNGWRVYTKASTGTVYVYCGETATVNVVQYPTIDVEDIEKSVTELGATPAGVGGSEITTDTQVKLFENFTIDPTANITDAYNAATIVIRAFAVQTKGFEDDPVGTENRKLAYDKAWEALLNAYPYIHTGSAA